MAFKFQYRFIFLFVVVFLTAISVEKGTADTGYTVGPSDELSITVYDNPDLSGSFTVSSNGVIVYPLLGQVSVSGLSVDQIEKILTQKLEKDYLHDPIVSVTIMQYRSKHVKILGASTKPAVFYLDKPMRILDLLTQAKDIPIITGNVLRGQKIRILRPESVEPDDPKNDQVRTIHVDLYELLIEGKKEANIPLQNGDIIYLPQNKMVHVIGEVKNPGSIPYEEGLTVLMATAKAGGTTKNASAKKTRIRRIKNGREVRIEAKMSTLVQPGDIIEVPIGGGAMVHVIGEVKKPGAYTYEEGLTVLMAITKAGGATKKASAKSTVIKRIIDGKEVEIEVNMGDPVQPEDIIEVPLSFW